MTEPDVTIHVCEMACGRPAPHSWVCWTCHAETVERVQSVTPEDLAALHLVAMRLASSAEPRTGRPAEGRGRDAVNLATLALHENLTTTWPARLAVLEREPIAHPRAHEDHHAIRQGVKRARVILDGEPPRWTDAEAAGLLGQIELLTAAQIEEWAPRVLRRRIPARRVRVWAHRGKITAISPGRYHPADVLRALADTA